MHPSQTIHRQGLAFFVRLAVLLFKAPLGRFSLLRIVFGASWLLTEHCIITLGVLLFTSLYEDPGAPACFCVFPHAPFRTRPCTDLKARVVFYCAELGDGVSALMSQIHWERFFYLVRPATRLVARVRRGLLGGQTIDPTVLSAVVVGLVCGMGARRFARLGWADCDAASPAQLKPRLLNVPLDCFARQLLCPSSSLWLQSAPSSSSW